MSISDQSIAHAGSSTLLDYHYVWRYDTQHNDIQHNDPQYNNTQHNDTQHNHIQHNGK